MPTDFLLFQKLSLDYFLRCLTLKTISLICVLCYGFIWQNTPIKSFSAMSYQYFKYISDIKPFATSVAFTPLIKC